MKKFLAILVVMALVAPTMASVGVATDNSTNGELTITLTADGAETTGIVGVALTVDSATAIEDVIIAESFFDVNIDSAFTQEQGAGYVYGTGTPIAFQGQAGETTLAADGQAFSISVGGLDDDPDTAADDPPLTCTITLVCAAGSADVDICLDTLRGTIVDYNGAVTVTGLDIDDCVKDLVINGGVLECLKDVPGSGYADWVTYNKPDCWCYGAQCKGDLDGKEQLNGAVNVYTDDMDIFVPNFGTKSTTEPAVCADIDHSTQLNGAVNVYTDDMNIFVPNFGSKQDFTSGCSADWYNFHLTPTP